MFEKVKLSKRQIKEDKFTAFMLSSKKQLEDNWQYMAIGVVVVILVVVGVIYYFNSVKESTNKAAIQLYQANMQHRQGSNDVAILTLTDILSKYAKTDAAEEATFLLGKINLERRNYDEAKLYFDMYLEKYKKEPLHRAASMNGLGVVLENQGKYAEAAAEFEKGISEFTDGPLIGDMHMGAMRNYLLAGQVDKAKAHLDIINKDFQGTEVATSAARLFYEKSQS